MYYIGSACTNNKNGCCDGPSGSTCTEIGQYYWQCLPSSNNETPVTAAPTISSTPPPSNAPVTTITTTTPTIPPTRQSSSPSRCGCDSSCTQQVLDSLADGYSCGSRIDWVVSKVGLTESDACKMVGDEYPTICGACDCYSDSSPIPSPIENPPSPPTPGDIAPSSSQNDIEWDGSDLVLTHYWDCSGYVILYFLSRWPTSISIYFSHIFIYCSSNHQSYSQANHVMLPRFRRGTTTSIDRRLATVPRIQMTLVDLHRTEKNCG